MPERTFTLAQLQAEIECIIDRRLQLPTIQNELDRLADSYGLRRLTVRRAYRTVLKLREQRGNHENHENKCSN